MINKNIKNFLILVCLSFGVWAQTVSNDQSKQGPDNLSQDIQALKEKVFKTKAQVHELRDNVLRGDASGSKAYIEFKNNAEGLYTLESAEFWLDNEMIYKMVDASSKDAENAQKIFDEALPSGAHEIKIKAIYKGSKKKLFSAFEYFKGQKIELEKTEKFFVDFGKTTVVNISTLDKGYFKEDYQNRLQMNIQVIQNWGVD